MAKKTALVVDNDFFFVEFFTELLKKKDYEVSKAYNGKEGIEKLNEGPVDLLFVDFVMPKIGGKQLIRYARQKFADSPFPIVAVSGTMIEQMDDLQEIEADCYVAKGPLDVMAEQLNRFVDRIGTGPERLFSGNKMIKPDMIFPRREALDLLDSLHFQEAILQCAGTGIVTVDKDMTVLDANGAALEMLEKSAFEVVGKNAAQLFSKKEAEALSDSMKALLRNRDLYKINMAANINGKGLEVVVTLLCVKGECKGWVLVLINGEGSA